ncbi:DBF4-type zinc finger-containing protein 2 [Dunckerocampus dactyliophorus]|uniref:DBF4-type zinc finger-containing protein 2 n=1 Tax=Dunckerocampus dactyliophorus TaxID=161453 RepID=UPI002406A25A|nr:DBF4-type zinc finger-containing protein 2 [Dunckerocampus dactyliophorus]
MWAESQQGPSGCAPCRRGYCAYCQVHYRDLDQHLASVRHLDCVEGSPKVSASADGSRGNETLLERFLQDVLLHHPHCYKDSRPSDVDLPSVSAPLLPRQHLDQVCFSDDSCSSGTREHRPSSDNVSEHLTDLEAGPGPHSQLEERGRRRGAVGQERHTHKQQAPSPVHRKAHRKTDRRKSTRSLKGPCAGTPPLSLSVPVPPHWQSWQRPCSAASKEHSDLLEQTLEEEDTESFQVSAPLQAHSHSDWDSLVQVLSHGQQLQTQARDFSHLTHAQVDLTDQLYSQQLHAALRSEPRAAQVPQHFPQSFRGKTWSQIEEEDEKKVEDLVRQFRQGRFVCYFDKESRARSGRGQEEAAVSDAGFLALANPDEDEMRKRRGFRMASRCQVVKVSHSTQTVHLVIPTVCQSTTEATPTTCPPAGAERTPEVRCKCLPPSYSPIVTPLQASTSLVYLLSSPTFPAPTCTRAAGHTPKRSRKRQRPQDFQRLKVKYKPFPVRFYDPRSNHIIKNPPKGLKSSTPSGPLPPCVRQLFRSLSPDLNAERLSGEGGKVPTSSLGSHVAVSVLSADPAHAHKHHSLPGRRDPRERRTGTSSPATDGLHHKHAAPQPCARLRPRRGRPQGGCEKAAK